MEYYKFAIEVALQAGEILKESAKKSVEVTYKESDYKNIITDVDIKINDFITNKIKEKFPDHQIYSEEDKISEDADNNQFIWTIDPIDGTANFSRNIPHFAICIGLLQNNVPIIGVVYNPITDEMFSFEKDVGSFLNNKQIHTSSITDIKEVQCLLTVGHKESLLDWGATIFKSFLENFKKIRLLGSSSLDLCFLASGRVDIVVYGTMTTKDVASAIGIMREAGGEVYSTKGEPVSFSSTPQTIIATSNKKLFDEIKPLLHLELLIG